jgi:hypothetical protein
MTCQKFSDVAILPRQKISDMSFLQRQNFFFGMPNLTRQNFSDVLNLAC